MLKKFLTLSLPLLLVGCASNFTNLTPTRQVRNTENLYPVEVQFDSRQQTLHWQSIKPYVQVGDQTLPLRPTPKMNNRWEGLVPVPADRTNVQYRYKFDYEYEAFGPAQKDSALSKNYNLKIIEAK
jgi:hypothetical protein